MLLNCHLVLPRGKLVLFFGVFPEGHGALRREVRAAEGALEGAVPAAPLLVGRERRPRPLFFLDVGQVGTLLILQL